MDLAEIKANIATTKDNIKSIQDTLLLYPPLPQCNDLESRDRRLYEKRLDKYEQRLDKYEQRLEKYEQDLREEKRRLDIPRLYYKNILAPTGYPAVDKAISVFKGLLKQDSFLMSLMHIPNLSLEEVKEFMSNGEIIIRAYSLTSYNQELLQRGYQDCVWAEKYNYIFGWVDPAVPDEERTIWINSEYFKQDYNRNDVELQNCLFVTALITICHEFNHLITKNISKKSPTNPFAKKIPCDPPLKHLESGDIWESMNIFGRFGVTVDPSNPYKILKVFRREDENVAYYFDRKLFEHLNMSDYSDKDLFPIPYELVEGEGERVDFKSVMAAKLSCGSEGDHCSVLEESIPVFPFTKSAKVVDSPVDKR